MNDENLIPTTKRSKSEARANSRKGGIASGIARRKKADLRRQAQELLDATFTDKNGKTNTGSEILMKGMIANLSDPKGKNWSKAVDFVMQLTGNSMTKEQIAKIKAETALTKAKTKALEQNGGSLADIEDLTPIADMLRGGTDEPNTND